MDLEKILCDLADEVRAIDTRREALRAFHESILAHGDCFSPEELEATRAKIEAEESLRAEKVNALEQKLLVYETRIVELERRLAQRKSVIDDGSALEATPELLDLFAQHQVRLNEDLHSAREFLLS